MKIENQDVINVLDEINHNLRINTKNSCVIEKNIVSACYKSARAMVKTISTIELQKQFEPQQVTLLNDFCSVFKRIDLNVPQDDDAALENIDFESCLDLAEIAKLARESFNT